MFKDVSDSYDGHVKGKFKILVHTTIITQLKSREYVISLLFILLLTLKQQFDLRRNKESSSSAVNILSLINKQLNY